LKEGDNLALFIQRVADSTAWETSGRSLAKAISYRVVSSLVTRSIFFGATQRVRLAVALALIESIVKIGIFYIHERTWMKIAFGRDNHTGQNSTAFDSI
jgi:uncharacterized membrane protein